MSKIGLLISTCQEGYREMPAINGDGSWEKQCVDLRTTILSRHIYDDAPKKYGVFMRFCKQGSYITVWKFLSGSQNDFTAFWLFIPSGLKIEGKEVLGLINKVKDALPSIDKEQTQKDIKDLLSDEYDTDKNAPSPIESTKGLTSGAVAFRKYKDEKELEDLIGNKRCQKYYEAYAAILLTGPNGLQLKSPDYIKDLTKEKLSEYAMLPLLNEQGISVLIDNSEYTQKRTFEIGKGLKLTFKKDDREDIVCGKVKFEDPDTFWEKAAADLKWKKKITRDMFHVTAKPKVGDEVHDPECTIKINGETLTKKGILIPEDKLSESQVEITLDHFETKKGVFNLTSKIISINMEEKKEYTHSQYNKLEKDCKAKDDELSLKNEEISSLNTRIQNLEKDIGKKDKKIENRKQKLNKENTKTTDEPVDENSCNGDEDDVTSRTGKNKNGENNTDAKTKDRNNQPDPQEQEIHEPSASSGGESPEEKKNKWTIWLMVYAVVTTMIAVALAILLLTGKTLPDLTSVSSNDNAAATATLQTEPAATAEVTDSVPAINYLKNCDGILFRDSLEHYSYTKGLWDDLNDFNLDKVIGEWAEKLRGRGIQCFEDIAEHANNCIDKNLLDKAKEKNSGHYNKAEDLKINVKNYCNWIDAACDKTTPSNDAEDKYGSGN